MKPSSTPKKLNSLSDLRQLLPEAEQKQAPKPHPASLPAHDGKGQRAHIHLEKKGRKGKSVTVVSGLRHNPSTLQEIAGILKRHCGSGGTVKDGTIEIQGDQRVRVGEKLRELNYVVD